MVFCTPLCFKAISVITVVIIIECKDIDVLTVLKCMNTFHFN